MTETGMLMNVYFSSDSRQKPKAGKQQREGSWLRNHPHLNRQTSYLMAGAREGIQGKHHGAGLLPEGDITQEEKRRVQRLIRRSGINRSPPLSS
jgi:hypothetical protein